MFSQVYLVNSQIFILIGESFCDILEDRQESDTGRTPGRKELNQDFLILVENVGELLERVNGRDGRSLVPLAVVLILPPGTLGNLERTGQCSEASCYLLTLLQRALKGRRLPS